ncbi:MAG: hypothetical protein LBV75_07425 [Paludibacter sp.]|jgi:hypothetical protein|nr:hypothetical protein [Paludibacter sp.]
MKYLKINTPKTANKETKRQKFATKLLSVCFFMLANPDFDNIIPNAVSWLLEFEDENDFVNREIGLDESGNIIAKMPFKKNYGFWIDTDMKYYDFIKRFECEFISQNFFTSKWAELN